MGRNEHLKQAPKSIKISLITVSTTRSAAEDKSGNWIKRECEKEGHEIMEYRIVTDNRHEITMAISTTIDTHQPDIILVNGGTGISSSDVTVEAVKPLFTKELTGFGILFSTLSFQQIDSAAILSRATAGVIGNTAIFCMPGSLNACKLACIELIFPEIPHLVAHLRN